MNRHRKRACERKNDNDEEEEEEEEEDCNPQEAVVFIIS